MIVGHRNSGNKSEAIVFRSTGHLFSLFSLWLLAVVSWLVLGDMSSAIGWAAVMACFAAIIVHLILSGGIGYRATSVEALLVAVAGFYAVVIHGSTILYGLIPVPSAASLSEGDLLRATACASVYLVSVALGIRMFRREHVDPRWRWAKDLGVSSSSGVVLFVVGLVGMSFSFPSIASLLSYWQGTQEGTAAPSGLLGFLSTATRSFVPVGIAAALAGWFGRGRIWSAFYVIIVSIAGVLCLGTFSFNRAALVFPVIAVMMTVGTRMRIRRRTILLVILVSAVLFFSLGYYRLLLSPTYSGEISFGPWIAQTMQVYGQLSGNLGMLFQNPDKFSPHSLVSGLLSPLPLFGTEFRTDTGTAVYNRLLYGFGIVDQIPPVWAELWAVGGFTLVSLGGLLVGILLKWVANLSSRTSSPLLAFTANWGLVWGSLSVFYSISNLIQALVYMIAPVAIAGYLLRRRPAVEKIGD